MERPIASDAGAAPDDISWANRSEFWRTYKSVIRGRAKKFKYREPLILCGHAARIRVDHGTLLVRNGFTHYPQKSEEIRFFPGDPNLPDRIIILDASGGISFDALNWMSEQEISLVQLNWRGRINLISGPTGYSANPKLVAAQIRAKSGNSQLDISRWLIREKLLESHKTLIEVVPKSENQENAISGIKKWISEISNSKKSFSLSKIHGIEGPAAKEYFLGGHGIPLKWAGLKKKPIPDSWLEIGPRTMGWRKRSRAARHPVNAMLNYGYAILIGRVQAQTISAGLDPTVGIMHGNSENRIPLIYDLMEPHRPVVDRRILQFALAQTFCPGDFTINRFGACRLNPQMARAVIKAVDFNPKNIVTEFIRLLRA
jgi:CRISPR-associated endonuclease Cas1